MSSNSERPYTEDDLTGNKKALAKFVQRQIGKWPGPKKFSESKTKVSEIREVLLSPEHGFTTNRPPVVSTHPPKQSKVPSTPKTRPEDQEETLPPPDNTSTELINLRVYIEDLRITPVQRTVAILSLGISRKEDGSVEALSKEFFAALQKSNAAIEIPSTDPEDEEWKVPFIRVTHGSNSVATFDPETIEITPDYRFKLYVDNVPFTSNQNKESISSGSGTVPVLETSREESSENPDLPSATEISTSQSDPAVQFLRDKLTALSGYSSFAANRGRVMSNAVISADWRFAVDFTNRYNKLKTPVKINKESIHTALGVGSTWLSQAHKAVQIIDKYSSVAAVTSELAKEETTGSTVLYEFLVNFEKNNNMQG
ncbi:hypothetical protein R3P38DRAFT_3211787 [Favolaschia claudopus]|uniref:Uncharacterized protein n=1 Tax=Favolaschia claudopus TaxID=2862362 RepID=A0AAW0AFM1_9AGAR